MVFWRKDPAKNAEIAIFSQSHDFPEECYEFVNFLGYNLKLDKYK